MNINEIRAKYPNPEVSKMHGGQYCVLGAACMYKGIAHITTFPTALQSSAWLRIPIDAANEIIDANDSGDFDKAWRLLDEALASR